VEIGSTCGGGSGVAVWGEVGVECNVWGWGVRVWGLMCEVRGVRVRGWGVRFSD